MFRLDGVDAVSETPPELPTTLLSMWAVVVVSITFSASAPAPEIPRAMAPIATAMLAANVVEVIVAPSVALSETEPAFAVTPPGAPVMNASTSLEIVFEASATPIEIDPATPPTEAASDTAPVRTVIEELSCAVSDTLPALTPLESPFPLMKAWTWS